MAVIGGIKNLTKIGLKNLEKGRQEVLKAGETVTNKTLNKAQFTKPFIDTVDKKTGEVGAQKLSNFYTGKKANPVWVAGIGATYLGAKNIHEGTKESTTGRLQLATMNDFQEIGAPDIMMYDGVSQNSAPKNMNADGSLVFGLHNSRKG